MGYFIDIHKVALRVDGSQACLPSTPPFVYRNALIDLQPPLRSLTDQAQAHGARHRRGAHDRLEDQRLPHRERRMGPSARFQRVADNDEDPAEQLPARPADRGARLGAHGERDLDQPLERDGDEGEGGGAEDGEDDVGGREGAGAGGPDEGEVAQGDEHDGGLDEGEVGLCAVHEGRGDGGADEPDEDEDGARDAAFRFREAVRRQDLREEGGERVEEADVDAEGQEDEVEVWVVGEESGRFAQPGRRVGGGGGDGRGGFGRDEEGWEGGDGRDDGDVEDHVWYVGCFGC